MARINMHLLVLLLASLPAGSEERTRQQQPEASKHPVDLSAEATLLSCALPPEAQPSGLEHYRSLIREGQQYKLTIMDYLKGHEVSPEGEQELRLRLAEVANVLRSWQTRVATLERLEREDRIQADRRRAAWAPPAVPPVRTEPRVVAPPTGPLSITCPVRLCQAPPGHRCHNSVQGVPLKEATWELISRRSCGSTLSHPARVRAAKSVAKKASGRG